MQRNRVGQEMIGCRGRRDAQDRTDCCNRGGSAHPSATAPRAPFHRNMALVNPGEGSICGGNTSFARHVDDEERLLLALVVSKVQLAAGSVLDLEVEDGRGARSACVRHGTKPGRNRSRNGDGNLKKRPCFETTERLFSEAGYSRQADCIVSCPVVEPARSQACRHPVALCRAGAEFSLPTICTVVTAQASTSPHPLAFFSKSQPATESRPMVLGIAICQASNKPPQGQPLRSYTGAPRALL